ncbi:MAG: peptidoglycan-binding domain-containing protein [Acetobacteraceae bacterium]
MSQQGQIACARDGMRRWVGIGTIVVLAGCAQTPFEPTVQVMRGPDKPAAAFQQDQTACRQLAGMGVAGQRGARQEIQGRYDEFFGQCMYAHGDVVVGYPPRVAYLLAEPRPRHAAPRPAPELVRDVQGELMRLEYLDTSPDGSLGPKTQAAIKRFEHEHGMRAAGTVSKTLLQRLQTTSSHAATPVEADTEPKAPIAAAAADAPKP